MTRFRILVIVRRGETETFERLEAQYARQPDAQILWDRRVRDRRVIIQEVEVERRRGQRRAPTDATGWATRGFVVARVATPGTEGSNRIPGRPERRGRRPT